MITALLVAAISGLVAWYVIKPLLEGSKLKGLPGPKQIPIFGNMLQMNNNNPVLTFAQWSREFGNVCKVKLGGPEMVLVSGVDELYEVMTKKGKAFGGRMESFISEHMSEGQSDIFTRHTGPQLNALKKFTSQHLKGYGPKYKGLEEITIEVVDELMGDLGATNGIIDIQKTFTQVTINIIYIIQMGKKLQRKQDAEVLTRYSADFNTFVSAAGQGPLFNLMPWMRFFGHGLYKQMENAKKYRKETFQRWKEEIMAADPNDKTLEVNFIHNFYQMIKGSNPHEFDDTVIDLVTFNVLSAGFFTTQSAMAAFVNLLVHHPEIQKKLYAESKEVLHKDSPTFEDRNRMPYHYACMLELLRFTGIAPLIPHKTLEDTTLSGYHIPKGTDIMLNYWEQNHKESVWGDPYVYRPERYIDEHGELVPTNHHARVNTITFGGGPRACPGEQFAMTRMFILVAMMVQRFEWLPATTMEEQCSWECEKMKFGAVMEPEKNVYCRVKARA